MAKVLVCTLEMGTIRAEQRDWALALTQHGRHDLVFHRSRHKPTSSNRNEVALFMHEHPELTHMLVIDDDVVPPPNALDYVDADKDVIIFPCHIWQAKQNADHPVVLNISTKDSVWVDGRQGLLEVDRGGTGCMLVARRVLEHPNMQAPFADRFDANGIRSKGHDILFCDRARAAGFKVYAAMDGVCSHFKTVDLKMVSALLRRRQNYHEAFVAPREAVGDKRLIFCLSPGRCGTKYLTRLLRTVPDVAAYHEPQPNFVDVNQAAQQERPLAYQFWLERKLPAILQVDEPVYAETSHLFGQGFVEPLLRLGVVPDVVVLRRSLREVALSYWRRRSIPGRTKAGRTWLLMPPDRDDWTDYQMCYWFALEMEMRSVNAAWRLRRNGALVHETTLTALADGREGFEALLEELNLPEPDWTRYDEVAGQRVNATIGSRKDAFPDGDLDLQETEVATWMAT